jgi:hypothetical protein
LVDKSGNQQFGVNASIGRPEQPAGTAPAFAFLAA